MRAAALVERSRKGGSGRLDDGAGGYLPQAGVVGTLVDVFSGPVGGLTARPTDGFRAHGAPWHHADAHAVAVEEISRELEPGIALLIAEVEDPDPDVLDSALDALGGRTTRRAAEAFYADVRAVGPR